MKWLKRIAIVLALLILVLIVVGFFLPTAYSVSRDMDIAAPPEKIHSYVGDLAKWDAWTPWKDADPSIVVTDGGQTTGVGATQSWTGDSGAGSLVFTMSSPDKGVAFDLSFDDQFEAKSTIVYQGRGANETNVTWTMTGDAGIPVIGGYFALMMEGWVGPMYSLGLLKLKTAAEQQ